MKTLWIKLSGKWEKIKPLVTKSIESGVEVLVLDKENVKKVKELARGIKVASEEGGDIKIVKVKNKKEAERLKKGDCALIEVDSKEKEKLAEWVGKRVDFLIVETKDWKIIPLENLIANLQGEILAVAKDLKEIPLLAQILEKGVRGVVFSPKDITEIKKAKDILNELSLEKIVLEPAKITKIKNLGLGDRVCVDTTSILSMGEGMLIGSQSKGFFLVHSETLENPYVEARPFRVNAGAVHAYIKVSKEKTKYLCELSAGDEVLIVNKEGKIKKAIVGRVKIEKRPMVLVEAEIKNEKISTILQNAETVNLVGKNGKPISVSRLKEGDEVLVNLEKGGRHFGIKIKESIIEK